MSERSRERKRPMANEELKRQLRQRLVQLERDYRRAAQPYIDQLAQLEALEPPHLKPFHVNDLPVFLRQQLPAINKR